MNELLLILAQVEAEPVGLTIGGGILMTLSILLVMGLLIFCMIRVLRESHPEKHHHAPLEIDTHDLDS